MERNGNDRLHRVRYPLEEIQSNRNFRDTEWLLERWTPAYSFSKRMIDILVGIPLLILTVITFPFIALAIKLDSPGPVFYVQERVGKGGKVFPVIKYRSMVVNAEANGAQFARKNDSRITRIGAFLRTSRLDELPQSINVLLGQMSLVGPRPERPHVIGEISRTIPEFAMRTVVQPGLTGWAQVKGSYAATDAELAEKLEYDLFYIRNASFLKDIMVLAETISVVFKRKGL